jgi:hypothetical protein
MSADIKIDLGARLDEVLPREKAHHLPKAYI